jgi:SPP1 gp7 family putative phage head morphogenesis protein
MPLDDRTLRIVEQADRALDEIERQTMTAMEDALQASYNRLEAELLTKYRQNATNLDLLPNQRKLLILGQLKNNLDLIGGTNANDLKAGLTSALTQSSEEGAALAKALTKSIGNEDLGDFDGIPLEALRFQAEQGVDRLIQHGKAFAGRASSIVEIGLTTGAGPKKVAAELRKQLGVTKGRAVAIARTETLSSHNQAAQAAYQRAGLEYFQLISTQDARTCPICAARNMQVFKMGESTPPTHVMCRCYSLPWKSEWQEQGLSGDEWAADFRAGAISELERIGRKPDNGPSPFEKAAGLPAPNAVWSPGDALVRPSPPPPAPAPPPPEQIAIHEEYIARGSSAFESEFAELDAPVPPANIEQLNSALSAAQLEFVKAVDRVGGDIEAAWLEPEGAQVKAAYRAIESAKSDPGLQSITSIRRQLLSSGSAVDVSDVVITEGATIELRERQIRFEMREFYALAQGRGLSQLKGIEYIRERAEANPLTGMINVGLHDGDLVAAQTALWHEMAHMIEFEDPSIADAAKSWIRARATGPEQTINSIQGVSYYDADEVALPGKFVDPYVGKIYDQDATEVISMGLQHFTDPEEMLKFYREDPEHFRFVVGAVLKPR